MIMNNEDLPRDTLRNVMDEGQ